MNSVLMTTSRRVGVLADESPDGVFDGDENTRIANHLLSPNVPCILQDLPASVQLSIASFLSLSDVRRMRQVNVSWRTLLDNDDDNNSGGNYIWRLLARHQWPYLAHARSLVIVSDNESSTLSLSQLLERVAAAPSTPTTTSTLRSSSSSSLHHQLSHVQVMGDFSISLMARFTGSIGRGARSVRSHQPLPRPGRYAARRQQLQQQQQQHHQSLVVSSSNSIWRRLLLLRGSPGTKGADPLSSPKPLFVAPYSLGEGRFAATPRWVAYYEVSLLPEATQGATRRPSTLAATTTTTTIITNSVSPCVAVGLSTLSMDVHRNLPGWGPHSFGYHSDDGSFFAKNRCSPSYGPRFGPGDVVGCGIDYHERAVFYTLNGTFLGYDQTQRLSKAEVWHQSWYPTIGLDSHTTVQFNFGNDDCRPFVYNLADMMGQNNQHDLPRRNECVSTGNPPSNSQSKHVRMLSYAWDGKKAS